MALPNDSVAVTPGTGATIATHLASAKEYQVVMLARPNGQLVGGTETYIVATANVQNVAAARTTYIDLFNAVGTGVILRVYGLYIIPSMVAVTGVGNSWQVARTSSIGTGGFGVPAAYLDTTDTTLPLGVTARISPTGGATATVPTLLYPNGSSEETSPYAGLASTLNHIPVVAGLPQAIVLREGQGIKVDCVTNSAVGQTNVMLLFTATAT